MISWFLIDLGNTVIKLAYERVIESICREASVDRDELLDIFEMAGGYRDMERGATTFWQFHEFLGERAGYRGTVRDLHEIWANFFDGPTPGIEDLLARIRQKYRIAFLSNSNEVHAEVIPKQFAGLFERDDRFIFSYRFKVAKPDPEMFHRALETIGAQASDVVFIDDLIENVIAARGIGIRSFQCTDAQALLKQLQGEGLL
ncbi:MAG TPA: HAD family phosphatase [Thermoanaerobaculia bacterium]|nr:HAD family phosphatase [Thermoanaerobaculia bacterium]